MNDLAPFLRAESLPLLHSGRSSVWGIVRREGVVRLIYLDEAGISRADQEPVLVVAGPIVNPDTTWKRVRDYLARLAHDHLPEVQEPDRFVFHAKDVWHGSPPFDRRKFTRAKRMQILSQLAQVPRLYKLPVIVGAIDRAQAKLELVRQNRHITDRQVMRMTHAMAFAQAVAVAEDWLRRHAPRETAMVMVENAPDMRGAIEMLHDGYTAVGVPEGAFASHHLIEEVQFTRKPASPVLQVADHCAFIIKRRLSGKRDVDALFRLIEPAIHKGAAQVERFSVRIHPSQIAGDEDGPA